jgi:hypothetical protein
VGLGALTVDLLLAVLVTSALRHRIGYRSWRSIHWLAYLCWPIAMVHGLGTGSDSSRSPVLAVDAACTAALLGVVAWRLATGRTFRPRRRIGAAVVAVGVTTAIGIFAALGPLRPGWSHRAGTSSALLAEIAAKNGGPSVDGPAPQPATTAPPESALVPASGAVPSPPFSIPVTGTQSTTAPDTGGDVTVTLALQMQDTDSTPLVIVLDGSAAPGGGVSLSSGSVRLGPYRGPVTALAGDTVSATVSDPAPVALTVILRVDQATGALTGTVSGSTIAAGR